MTKRYIVCAFTLVFCAWAEPNIRKGGRRFSDTKRVSQMYQYYKAGNDMIKHGKEVYYYNLPKRNGERVVKLVRHWLNGVMHGLYTVKYSDPDSTIKETGRYENGNKIGTWQTFYPKGGKHKAAEFQDGELHGTVTEWTKDLKKVAETHYQRGKRHGLARHWYPDGKKKSQATFKRGVLDGTKSVWYKTGTPQSTVQYSDGVKHGMEKLWTEEGTPTSEIEYRDGKKQGMVRLWDDKGKLKSEIEYLDSVPHGQWKEYYSNGVVSRESTFKQGIRNGAEMFRLPSGVKRSLTTYRAGKEDGLKVLYNESGTPKEELMIKFGKKHGPSTTYTPDGSVFAKGEYRQDKPFEGSFAFENTLSNEHIYLVHYKAGAILDYSLYYKGKPAEGLISIFNSETGQLISKCDYVNGMKHGAEELYHSNGKLGRKLTWFKNQPDGLVQQWHKKGPKTWEAQYEKGIKNGYEKAWDLDGNSLIDGTYRNGKPWNGTLFVRDPKTKAEIILVFEEGKQIKELPNQLKKLFSEPGSQVDIKGNVERIPWKDLGVGN